MDSKCLPRKSLKPRTFGERSCTPGERLKTEIVQNALKYEAAEKSRALASVHGLILQSHTPYAVRLTKVK